MVINTYLRFIKLMEEKLFEAKFIFDLVEVFKDRISITTKPFGLGFLGGTKMIPMSQVASVDAPPGKPVHVETTGGKRIVVGLTRKRIPEFIAAVTRAQSQR